MTLLHRQSKLLYKDQQSYPQDLSSYRRNTARLARSQEVELNIAKRRSNAKTSTPRVTSSSKHDAPLHSPYLSQKKDLLPETQSSTRLFGVRNRKDGGDSHAESFIDQPDLELQGVSGAQFIRSVNPLV